MIDDLDILDKYVRSSTNIDEKFIPDGIENIQALQNFSQGDKEITFQRYSLPPLKGSSDIEDYVVSLENAKLDFNSKRVTYKKEERIKMLNEKIEKETRKTKELYDTITESMLKSEMINKMYAFDMASGLIISTTSIIFIKDIYALPFIILGLSIFLTSYVSKKLTEKAKRSNTVL